MIIADIFLAIIFLFAAFTVIYSFVFSIAGLFARHIKLSTQQVYKKTIVLIPASKDEDVVSTVSHSLHQAYPSDKFDIVVIADSLNQSTLSKLGGLSVRVIESRFNGSHALAIREALKQISEPYGNAVILRSGDRMQIDFLLNVNNALASGCYAIQGHRIPLRLNNSFAILEGLCHDIHNHIFRKGQQALGFSASMSSSAIGISFLYLQQIIEEINPDESLEKELELKLIDDNHRIFYLDTAIVKNDQAQDSMQFIAHSSQYIIGQMTHLRKHLGRGILSFVFGRTDFANRIVYYAMVPNLIMMVFLLAAFLLSLLMPAGYIIHSSHWLLLTLMYTVSMILATPVRYFKFKTLTALASLPFNFIKMMRAVVMMKHKAPAAPDKNSEIPVVSNE